MLLCSVDNITFGPGLLSVGGKSLPEVGGLRYLVFCDQPFGRRSGSQHRRQRKMLNPIFSTDNIRNMTPLFYDISRKVHTPIPYMRRVRELMLLLSASGFHCNIGRRYFSGSGRRALVFSCRARTCRARRYGHFFRSSNPGCPGAPSYGRSHKERGVSPQIFCSISVKS